ncbi:MAG: NADH-quinone oxidoreductase subunit C [candidate division Zixibacteria bacterium]|nr:NADH-quinone oxidoreductase subunit C [candidate division Zixibacteria bacterium]
MTKEELTAYVGGHFDGKLKLLDTGRYDPMFEIQPGDLLDVARALRDDSRLQFDYLCSMGGVDTGEHLEVVYSIASSKTKSRLDFKFSLPYDKAEIDSIQEVWPGINWYEREAWELYGINVRNHGNLKRFLLPDDWDQGHPMLKNWDAPDFIRMPER